MPSFLEISAKSLTDSAVMRFFPQSAHLNDGMGTPHDLWRDRHQSGLVSTMPLNLDSPHEGTHSVWSTVSSPFFLKSLCSMLKNHCSVAL